MRTKGFQPPESIRIRRPRDFLKVGFGFGSCSGRARTVHDPQLNVMMDGDFGWRLTGRQ